MHNPAFISDVTLDISKRHNVAIGERDQVSNDQENQDQEKSSLDLARKIGFSRGTAFVVGMVIGAGIFISPGKVLAKSGSTGLCLILWLISGFLSSLGALAYAELGTLIPKSGGDYSYFLQCFGDMHPFWGPLPAFLNIWINILFTKAASQAICSYSLANYVITPFLEGFEICRDSESVALAFKLGALLSLGVVTFINCYGVSLAAKVQVVFTIAKVVVIAIVIGGGFYKMSTGSTQYLGQGMDGTTDSVGDIAEAFYACLFAYSGWAHITLITEEISNPEKNLPRSILAGIAIVTFCNVLINVAFLAVLSHDEMVSSNAVATDWGKYVLGSANVIIPFFVAISIFGSHNGLSFTFARLCYAGGREGHFPRILSYIDIERRTPKPAILFNAFLSAIMILVGNLSILINIFSFTTWIFTALAMVVLLIMKKRSKETKVLYRTHICIPIIVLLMAIFLVIMPIVTNPSVELLYCILAFFVGFLYYVPFVYYRKSLPLLSSIGTVMEKLLNVSPSKLHEK